MKCLFYSPINDIIFFLLGNQHCDDIVYDFISYLDYDNAFRIYTDYSIFLAIGNSSSVISVHVC